MSWHFSRALVAEYSAATCSDGAQSAPSNTTPTPETYYWPDKTTEHSRLSRFGMTCEPLTEVLGEALLTWFQAGSLARTLAQQEKAQGLMASEADYGPRWFGSFATYSPATSSWKTAQCSLVEDLEKFSETWPKWGSMRNGVSYQRQIPELRICESASGLWPTPCASDTSDRQVSKSVHITANGLPKHIGKSGELSQMRLSQAVKMWPTPCARDYKGIGRSRLDRTGSKAGECLPQVVGGMLNPDWTEWLMGWPIGWTDLKPLETGRFQKWLQQHGKS